MVRVECGREGETGLGCCARVEDPRGVLGWHHALMELPLAGGAFSGVTCGVSQRTTLAHSGRPWGVPILRFGSHVTVRIGGVWITADIEVP